MVGEIGPLSTSHNDADGILKPQPEARDRDLPWSDGIRDDARHRAWLGGHPATERLADGTGLRSRMALLGHPDHLDRRAIHRIVQPDIGKVQAQQT
jgi:hypothetical protein